jgi:hypothetical protein
MNRFSSYCQLCVFATHPRMMTGYYLADHTCDRCGRRRDCAMVRDDTKPQSHNPWQDEGGES